TPVKSQLNQRLPTEIIIFTTLVKANFMKHINTVALMAAVALGFGSCKQQAIMVNPGAVVTKDGTDDGLKNVKSEFEDATRTNEGIKFTISSDLFFRTNSSYLTDKAKVELSKLAKLL